MGGFIENREWLEGQITAGVTRKEIAKKADTYLWTIALKIKEFGLVGLTPNCKKGRIAWNKGITKEDNPNLARTDKTKAKIRSTLRRKIDSGEIVSKTIGRVFTVEEAEKQKKGLAKYFELHSAHNKGVAASEESGIKISNTLKRKVKEGTFIPGFKKGMIPHNKGISMYPFNVKNICTICGSEYIIIMYRSDTFIKKTCSTKCTNVLKSGRISSVKGLTKETSETVMKASDTRNKRLELGIIIPSMKGKHQSDKQKEAISLAHRGIPVKEEVKKRISNTLVDKYINGELNPSFSLNQYKAGFKEDLGHFVRSSWEYSVCKLLKEFDVQYDYEKYSFKIKVDKKICSYRPDLYLPKYRAFIEIKGRVFNKDIKTGMDKKVRAFSLQYPDKLIYYLDKDIYYQIFNPEIDSIAKFVLFKRFLKTKGV